MKTKKARSKRTVKELSNDELRSIYGGIAYKLIYVDGKYLLVRVD